MKKITAIEIENFRAFYGSYKIILSEGENLLVYGENGSGKSSLYKALNAHFASSRTPAFPFTKNNYRSVLDDGIIKVKFADYDANLNEIVHGTEQELDFGTASITNAVNFEQDAELTRGFLDYRILLAVYNHADANPNLFSLIVFELLKNFIPVGTTFTLGNRFTEVANEIRFAYTRETWTYRLAIPKMQMYEAILRNTLDRIFVQLNFFLDEYFKINLVVSYNLKPLVASAHNWRNIPQELRLSIKHNNIQVLHQSDYLNEARLSALSICLYLAAQKEIPQNIDYKILFLDDVFIGLDSGNRIPIAKILNREFSDYQIFITTYDRNWFELAKRYFDGQSTKKWSAAEIYSTSRVDGQTIFDVPVLIPYEENFDRAVFYLNHKTKPDYPAAANFFRKAVEEVLKANLPEHENRDDNFKTYETYKLGAYVSSTFHFLEKINADTSLISELKNALPTLLHPLSHYDLSAQVYRAELEEVQNLVPKISEFLNSLKATYKVFIPQGRKIKLNFAINASDFGHYEIETKETVYIYTDELGNSNISSGICHSKCSYTVIGGIESQRINFPNNNVNMHYKSFIDCYRKIHRFIQLNPLYSHITSVANPHTEFDYHDEKGNHSIQHHIDTVIW